MRVSHNPLGEIYTHETESDIKAAIRSDPSPWLELKRYGQRALTGQAATAGRALFDALEEMGIAIVRDGELESLAPYIEKKKGPDWIREALRQQAYLNDEVQRHIQHVISAVHHRLGINLHIRRLR